MVRVATAWLPTAIGLFQLAGYRSLVSDEEFVALFKGDIRAAKPTLARIHSQCLTGDVFGSTKCDCGPQLQRTMELIEEPLLDYIIYFSGAQRGIFQILPNHNQLNWRGRSDVGDCQYFGHLLQIFE